jgi:hypothetical protein
MLFRLEINDGSSGGRTSSLPSSSYALHPNVPTIVGRDCSVAHIPIQDNSVSRKHAIITVVVVSVDASSSSASDKVGNNIFLDVVDCGSKLGTRVSAVSLLDGGGREEEEEEEEEEKKKLERVEAGTTRRVPLSPESSTTKITTSEEKKKKREGWRRAWLLKFGKISATVRCIEEENETTKKNGLDAADENKEEEGEATESDDDNDDDGDEKDQKSGKGSGDDDGDEGVRWKRPKTKREQKKMDRNNRGQVNVDRDEVEVETVVDASLFRERIISPSQSSPLPRLFSANEQQDNDENRLGRVDVSNAKNKDVNNNVNTNNKKRFQKQSITINGKLTSQEHTLSPSSKLKIKKQKVPWPYETDGYETLAQFETALDREEKAAQRLKEKIAEDLFEDPSVNAASLKKRGEGKRNVCTF